VPVLVYNPAAPSEGIPSLDSFIALGIGGANKFLFLRVFALAGDFLIFLLKVLP
jgi:hypothetical protein